MKRLSFLFLIFMFSLSLNFSHIYAYEDFAPDSPEDRPTQSIEHLKHTAQKLMMTNDQLKQETHRLTNEMRDLRRHLQVLQEQKKSLDQDSVQLNQGLASSLTKLEDLKSRQQMVAKKSHQIQSGQTSLEHQLLHEERQVKQLEKRAQILKEEIEKLKTQPIIETQVNYPPEENDILIQQQKILQQQLRELGREITSAQKEIDFLKNQEDLLLEEDVSDQKIAELQGKRNNLADLLAGSADSKAVSREDLKAKISTLSSENQVLRKKLTELMD